MPRYFISISASLTIVAASWTSPTFVAAEIAVDIAGEVSDGEVEIDSDRAGLVTVAWPVGGGKRGVAVFRTSTERPLIESLAIGDGGGAPKVVARNLAPVTAITVGTRNLDTPAGWTIFFDKVHERPYERHAAQLQPKNVHAKAAGTRGTLTFDGLTAGPFSGNLVFTFYAGSPLILAEAVVTTAEDRRAMIYDAGLVAEPGAVKRFVWSDVGDVLKSQSAAEAKPGATRGVKYRAIAAETADGAVVVFPPPHRFFYPLDFADNFGFNWLGRDYRDSTTTLSGDGWGVHQPPEGDRRFVPWVNAPPGTSQRLGAFYLLSDADGAAALDTVKRYTHADRYPRVPDYKTFTSHYHIEHTLDLLKQQAAANSAEIPIGLEVPSFLKVFRETGVDVVHLAEFHNGQTPKLPAPERLRQLRMLHDECRRLSDDSFLLLPGEEPNVHLGGHWISFFPRPVLWVLNRPEGTPFVEQTATGETIYHVGSAADVLELMQREKGLMCTAHARIKSSFGFPDNYRETPFFQSPHFLGAAWKAMPADYSHDALGRRVLDLFDDMNNWSGPKQVLGEVDVFKVQPGYELYGHANINYVRLERLPRFDDGWQPILDALRRGDFFTTTGEILVTDFAAIRSADRSVAVRAKLKWTFPLQHAEIFGGDGAKTVRHRVDLTQTKEFGELDFAEQLPAEFAGCRWIRLEVWDVAVDGAFTQPLWLK